MNIEPETDLEGTLRALAACGEALTAIASVAVDDVFGKESPFNQRCMAGLALATWKLADFAYWESREPSGRRREVEFTVDDDMATKLDFIAEQWKCDRGEAASRILSEQMHEWARKLVP